MDETDLKLCKLLMVNSRAPYRELAEKLGITVQAVHRRSQSLVNEGIILRFTGRISAKRLNAVFVGIHGVSRVKSVEEVLTRLKADDRVAGVSIAGANQLFIGAILRGLGELEPFIDWIKKAVEMPEPNVGLLGRIYRSGSGRSGSERDLELSKLDYRIVGSLLRDSRKPAADIAAELNVSVKTVKRHLERLEKEGAMEFTIDWQPTLSEGISAFLMINLRPDADKAETMNRLNKEFGDNLLSIMSGGNAPDILLLQAWSRTSARFLEMCDRMSRLAGVNQVTSYIVHGMYGFETWRDRLPAERAKKG